MPKKLLQDIVRVKRASHGEQAREKLIQQSNEETKPIETKHKKNRPKYKLWGVAIISLVFLLFALSYLFLKVTVAVNPKIQDAILNENLSASLDREEKALPFDLIVISGEENKTVPAAAQKDLAEKAEGIVVIYNAFSAAPQKLSIDTRLTGSNGKIYKTKKALTVPGMKGNIPGSVEVGIYGSAAGEEYNSDPLDFTIYGFRGTPKYSKFYGRSKGSLTGGFKGQASVISDELKSATIKELKTTLEAKLFKKATDQIPSGFILFKDAVFLTIDDSRAADNFGPALGGDNMLPVSLKATLYGFLINEDKLTKKIAEDSITGYDGSSVYIPNIRDITFSLSSKDNILFGDVKNINFNLSGTAKIVWKVDESKLAMSLLGKSKKDFNQILSQYPSIDSADLVVSPFWKTSLPDKTKDIKVIVKYPK